MINDAFGFGSLHDQNDANSFVKDANNNNEMQEQTMDEATIEFYELVNDGNQELNKGCKKYSKLYFFVKIVPY